MKKTLPALLCLLLCLPLFASAETPMGEGYIVQDNKLSIHLWAGSDTGCAWVCEVADESVIALQSELQSAPDASSPDGVSRMHTWTFVPNADGEALITFSYEDQNDAEPPQRALCYTAVIEGGQLTGVEMEDLSQDAEGSGDDDAVMRYDGETGGVELNVPEGMVETETEDGALLTSEDGARTILIDYQPNDSPEELFEQLKDRDTAAQVYEDDDATIQVISSAVDPDSDPPSATLVLSSPEGYTVYTGYQAPEGGVLHVHTTYSFGGVE